MGATYRKPWLRLHVANVSIAPSRPFAVVSLTGVKVSVIGCGYLGAVHAACMASLGHDVVGLDVDRPKVEALVAATAPFYEPGLDELLSEQLRSGRLTFTTDSSDLYGCTLHFICVGTPQKKGENAADLSYLDAAVEQLIPVLEPGDVVVGKSTVPVGTAERITELVGKATTSVAVAWNPEFLREGHAIEDTLRPDRLVYGVTPDVLGERARAALDLLYAPLLSVGTPLVVTDLGTAQLVKVAANSFLATKISFINAMAEVAKPSTRT